MSNTQFLMKVFIQNKGGAGGRILFQSKMRNIDFLLEKVGILNPTIYHPAGVSVPTIHFHIS